LPYARSVPANGTAFLGFALSEAVSTAGAKTLGSAAVVDMINAPTITSPANGATLHTRTTTIKGTLFAGANGLPTSVVVNGHPAQITIGTPIKASYAVTFTESYGTHTITATARDSAGNTRSRSIKIHNVQP
jgi:hypothetical protein